MLSGVIAFVEIRGGFVRLKGQAFETMMLVISVIVALAILGVLLNILGGINFTGVGDPSAVMKDGLKQIQSSGYGITTAKKATFDRGSLIRKKSVIQDIPISLTELSFACEGTAICGTGKVEITNPGQDTESFESNSRLEAFIVVCGDAQKSTDPKFCVGIGRLEKDAKNACTTKCGI